MAGSPCIGSEIVCGNAVGTKPDLPDQMLWPCRIEWGRGGVEQALGYHMTARLLIAFLCQLSVAFMLIGIDPGPILLIVLCLFASFH